MPAPPLFKDYDSPKFSVMLMWCFCREYSAVKSEVDALKTELESLRTERDVSGLGRQQISK